MIGVAVVAAYDTKQGELERHKSHLKPSGYVVMETTWRVRVQPRWGRVALVDIKPTAVQSWMAELGQSTVERKAIGAAAVKRAHHVRLDDLAPQRSHTAD